MTISTNQPRQTRTFQLTHPWGCDRSWVRLQRNLLVFQLTHPWGCDMYDVKLCTCDIRFQLTHPWGCDKINLILTNGNMSFQLTHPWGCDLETAELFNSKLISTHTPVRVWHVHPIFSENSVYFNSHTREGVTRRPSGKDYPRNISTHTPVRVWQFVACPVQG